MQKTDRLLWRAARERKNMQNADRPLRQVALERNKNMQSADSLLRRVARERKSVQNADLLPRRVARER